MGKLPNYLPNMRYLDIKNLITIFIFSYLSKNKFIFFAFTHILVYAVHVHLFIFNHFVHTLLNQFK